MGLATWIGMAVGIGVKIALAFMVDVLFSIVTNSGITSSSGSSAAASSAAVVPERHPGTSGARRIVEVPQNLQVEGSDDASSPACHAPVRTRALRACGSRAV